MPIAVRGRVRVATVLERYGYEVPLKHVHSARTARPAHVTVYILSLSLREHCICIKSSPHSTKLEHQPLADGLLLSSFDLQEQLL